MKRADSRAIKDEERRAILSKADIAKTEALAIGTEAEVYRRDAETLLKIYAGAERYAYFESLRELYASVDTSESGFRLPQIYHVLQFGSTVAVIETRIAGRPLEGLLPGLRGADLERVEAMYFDTVFALKKIRLKSEPSRYLLFDEDNQSDASAQRFEAFYAAFLEHKLRRVARFFQSLDETFNEKAAGLVRAIRDQPPVSLSLVHGDFFPGNMMVNETVDRVNGIIDFGAFTLFGNYLLDVAGAFGFYKMYAAERKANRRAMLPKVLRRIPSDTERKCFFQFLLANAILTSDLYASEPDPRTDDHFRWAAEIVSNQTYWARALH